MVVEISKVVDVLIAVSLLAYFFHMLHVTWIKKKRMNRLSLNSKCALLVFSNLYFRGMHIGYAHMVFAVVVCIVWFSIVVSPGLGIHMGWSLAATIATFMPLLLIRYMHS